MKLPRVLLPVLVAVILVIVLGAVTAARGHAPGASPQVTPLVRLSSKTAVRAGLETYLAKRYLAYRWVVCSKTHRTYRAQPLFFCNVNFGDPHVEPYCATLVAGTLITDHDVRAIHCGARLRGDEAASGKPE